MNDNLRNIENIYKRIFYNHREHDNDLWEQINNKLDSQISKEVVKTGSITGKILKIYLPSLIISGAIISSIFLFNNADNNLENDILTQNPVMNKSLKNDQNPDQLNSVIRQVKEMSTESEKNYQSNDDEQIIKNSIESQIPVITKKITIGNENRELADDIIDTEQDVKDNEFIEVPSKEKAQNKNKISAAISNNLADRALYSSNKNQIIETVNYIEKDSFYRNWKKYMRKKSLTWYVGINFIPEYYFSSISAIDEKIERIEDVKKDMMSYKLGVNLGYSFKNFILETGVNYSTKESVIEDKFGWTINNTLYTQTSDSVNFIINVSDSTIRTVYETGYDTTIISKDQNYLARSSYRVIEIPFIMGYRMSWGKSNIILKYGVIACFNSFSSEKIQAIDENQPYPYSTHKTSNINWFFVLSPEYDYALSRKIHLKVAPQLKYTQASIYKDDYPASKKIYYIGANVGLNYWF